jgi:hypothetical protein
MSKTARLEKSTTPIAGRNPMRYGKSLTTLLVVLVAHVFSAPTQAAEIVIGNVQSPYSIVINDVLKIVL